MLIDSDSGPEYVFRIAMLACPVPTWSTAILYAPSVPPDLRLTMSTSFSAIVVLFNWNTAVASLAKESAAVWICPAILFNVTNVTLLVDCCINPPEPELYPIPAVPLDIIAPVTVSDVPIALSIFGVINTGDISRTTLPVPVVDGVSSAIQQAELLVRLSPEKAREGSYALPPKKVNQGLSTHLQALIQSSQ